MGELLPHALVKSGTVLERFSDAASSVKYAFRKSSYYIGERAGKPPLSSAIFLSGV